MIASRKYTNLNWKTTQAFSTNPCFLKKMVYDVSRDTLTHPQKLWICQKILCYFASLRQDGMIQLTCTNFVSYFFFFGGGDEECVPGRINAKLEMQTTVTNIAQVSPHRAQDAFFKLTNALALFAK